MAVQNFSLGALLNLAYDATNQAFVLDVVGSTQGAAASTSNGVESLVNNAVDATKGALRVMMTQTATQNVQTDTTYALVATDQDSIVTLDNAGAVTVTINDTLPVGAKVTFIQKGAGKVTLSASGVTINSPDGNLSTRVQYSTIHIWKEAAGVYYASGDLGV